MSQKTSEYVSNCESKESSNDGILTEKTVHPNKDCGDSGAVYQTVDKLKTKSIEESNVEPRCANKESNGVENNTLNSINDSGSSNCLLFKSPLITHC